MTTIITLLFASFLSVTFAQTKNFDPNAFRVLNMDSIEYIPFEFKKQKSLVLSDEEIKLVDSFFNELQFKSNNGDRSIDEKGEIGSMTYNRQYLPFLNEKNEKVIWINCFCDDRFKDQWDKDVIVVKDGGNCFFSVILNLTIKKFEQLYVNGVG